MWRRMKCPGSLNFCKDIPPTTSEYAREGTAAHRLGEMALRENKPLTLYEGLKTEVEGDIFIADSGMIEAVSQYIEKVQADLVSFQPGATLSVEQSFNLDWLAPGLDMRGTNDACIEQKYGVLKVYDYKHGRGVAVNAKDNVQLKYYGLGAIWNPTLKDFKFFDTVICAISQPRVNVGEKYSEEEHKLSDLIAWGREELLPAARKCLEPDAPLKTGEWCVFCPGMSTCPAIREETLKTARIAFNDSIVPVESLGSLPSPATLEPEEISKILNKADLISAWVKELKLFALENMKSGVSYPGYKLVLGRKTRKWDDENAVRQEFGDAAIEKRVKSVAQMEQYLKAVGREDELSEVDISVTRSLSLVPETDKRLAYVPELEAFEDK